jgi:GNAT superfamily N-acetyltransferase
MDRRRAVTIDEIDILNFREGFTDDLIPMWRESFEEGVGIVDWHPIDEQRQFFLTEVLPHNDVRVAVLDGTIIGFVAANRESVSQLYVRRGFQRAGLGTRLLDWAKAQSGGSLWLYTFARNERACAFYERSGFTATEHGFEESWQLADVRYEWTAAPTNRR